MAKTKTKPEWVSLEVIDEMVEAVRPHLSAAVRHNVARWAAERRIEVAIERILGCEDVTIDDMADHYDHLCVMTDAPDEAEVTAQDVRNFLEMVGEVLIERKGKKR